jgi:hypothetical protein
MFLHIFCYIVSIIIDVIIIIIMIIIIIINAQLYTRVSPSDMSVTSRNSNYCIF